MNADWSQWLFDLMANRTVRLTIEGGIGDVFAHLEVYKERQWVHWLDTHEAETFEDAMRDLMQQYQGYATQGMTP